MTLKDVVALANAGFTAQQIAAFAGAEAQPPMQQPMQQPPMQQPPMQQPPMQQPPMQQPPMQQPPMQQQPVQQPPMQQLPMQQLPMQQPPADPVLAELQKLRETMQANALFRDQQPQQPSEDDILASIIIPTRKE